MGTLTARERNVAAAVVCLAGFWYFLRRVEPPPVALRWATWW